jgi:lipoprotein-releasing system permease protein
VNFLFAWRYFRSKKSTNAINIIAWISILAIVVGTTALIMVLSVFNGFEGIVKSLYSSFYPDIRIAPVSGKQIVLTAEQLAEIRKVKAVKAITLIAEEKALLQNGENQSLIYLKGVDTAYASVTNLPKHVIRGDFNTGSIDRPLLVLGAGIENAVGVQSDRNIFPLTIYMPRKNEVSLSDPLQSINADTINTSGTFVIQQEFDDKYAITNLDFVRRMLEMEPDHYTSAEISIDQNEDPEDVQKDINGLLGKGYMTETRYEQNKSLYNVMQAEKWVIYAILSLILVVAAFNMIGALTMLVLEKKKDITVLHALGADKTIIRKIFLSEGLLLAGLGGIVGMLLALFLTWLQVTFKLVPLEGGSFVIDYFPVKLDPMDFLLVGTTVMIIALLAAYIPANKAANQQFIIREE